MGQTVTGREQLRALFARFTLRAFRLETQPFYRESAGNEPLRRFLAGETPDDAWLADWLDTVREQVGTGRRFQRVRVLAEPPTDYQRYVRDLALRCNIPAGEEIRALSQTHAASLGLPEHDYWLFDDQWVAVMHFDEGGFTGAELVSDPSMIERYRQWTQAAWHHALTYEDYRTAAR